MRLAGLSPRAAWWATTFAVALVFLPLGAFFGYVFIASIGSEAHSTGPFPLLIVAWSVVFGITSVACLGTVLLRLLGKPSMWLGCIGAMLALGSPIFGPIALLVVIVAVGEFGNWQILVAIPAFLIVSVIVLEIVTRQVTRTREG